MPNMVSNERESKGEFKWKNSMISYAVSQLILSSRVKSVFLHITLKVGYNLRKFGMTLSGRNYIMYRSVLAAASR